MNPFTPEEDAEEIWSEARSEGIKKYRTGVAEHGGGFWTGGAAWYADQIRDEALDSVAYLHHLRRRLLSIRSLAAMMREDEAMTLSMAATILDYLAGEHPPKSSPAPRHHD